MEVKNPGPSTMTRFHLESYEAMGVHEIPPARYGRTVERIEHHYIRFAKGEPQDKLQFELDIQHEGD